MDSDFNIQNLTNSPFEYISSVTHQPNVLIIPDSYLYLSGDKYSHKGTHNEIDESKVNAIRKGGTLSLYGQIKTYGSDEKLLSTKTIKLFSYQVFNVSDDKPKFLIKKTYDITKSTLMDNAIQNIDIHFHDVMHSLKDEDFEMDSNDGKGKYMVLKKDVTVIQPLTIGYDWKKNEGTDGKRKIEQLSFDIQHDIIDFKDVPELCEGWM